MTCTFVQDGETLVEDGVFKLDSVGNMETTKTTIKASRGASVLGVYLFPDETFYHPVYFWSVAIGRVRSCRISYWLDYSQYFYYDKLLFGVSRQMETPLYFESTAVQDFNDAPYFLYSQKDLLGESYTLEVSIPNGAALFRVDENFNSVVAGSAALELTEPGTTDFMNNTVDKQYILVLPKDYAVATQSSMLASNCTGRYFAFTDVVMGPDGCLYFADNTNRALKRWDFDLQKMTDAASFDTPIRSLVVRGDGTVLVADGTRIWSYNCGSGTLTQKYDVSPRSLFSVHPVGSDYLLLSTMRFGGTYRLVRLSDFTETDSIEAPWFSRTSAYSPARGVVYMLVDGYYPEIVGYQAVDTLTGTLETHRAMATWAPYDADGGHPLRLFPDESLLAVSTGEIFDTSPEGEIFAEYPNTPPHAGSLGESYADLLFHNGRILLLHNEQASESAPVTTSLRVHSQTSPFGQTGILLNLSGKGRRLLMRGNNLVIVTQPSIRLDNTDVYDDGIISIHEYAIDALLDAGAERLPGMGGSYSQHDLRLINRFAPRFSAR